VKLGVLTVLYQDLPVEEVLDKAGELGLEAVELGTGNFPGNAHCDPEALLGDRERAAALKREVEARGLIISALSQHGNPLHPQEDVARGAHEVWCRTLELAEQLEVPVVNAFPGLPGDHPGARHPNWVTCPWPPDFLEVLEWQWNERIIPYWLEEAERARSRGVKVAFEMHPGMSVYNPETLLRLRAAAGDVIGANFDPSHLFWQGIDPVEAIRVLGREGAIFHAHAKDCYVDHRNVRLNGVLDAKHYGNVADRSWTFRTIGYGHGEEVWREIVSALRMVGYDYVLSIEHEDSLMSVDEGLGKAVATLRSVLIGDPAGEMFWA
jgi:sugar phosphate isomerase/epimerase